MSVRKTEGQFWTNRLEVAMLSRPCTRKSICFFISQYFYSEETVRVGNICSLDNCTILVLFISWYRKLYSHDVVKGNVVLY